MTSLKPPKEAPRRGEVWTASGGKDYASKPRPVVILQDDSFTSTDSVTVCPLTTDEMEAPIFRLPIAPGTFNGLREPCRLMADKMSTIPKSKLGTRIGHLDEADIQRLNQAVIVFLGLAASPRSRAASTPAPALTTPPADHA